MNKDEIVELMKSSKTPKEWDSNCDKVVADNGGSYPYWWDYNTIYPILNACQSKWDEQGEKS